MRSRRFYWSSTIFLIGVVLAVAGLVALLSTTLGGKQQAFGAGPALDAVSTTTQACGCFSIKLTAPAGSGNLLIAVVSRDGGSGSGVITPPGGWTAIDEGSSASDASRLGVFLLSPGGVGGTSYTFTWTGSEQAVGAILRYSGADKTTPIDKSAFATGTSLSPTAPKIVTNVANTQILRVYGADDDDLVALSFPVGHTFRFNLESSFGLETVSGGGADKKQAAAGSTGAAAFSITDNEQWRAVTVAIKPEPPCPRGKVPLGGGGGGLAGGARPGCGTPTPTATPTDTPTPTATPTATATPTQTPKGGVPFPYFSIIGGASEGTVDPTESVLYLPIFYDEDSTDLSEVEQLMPTAGFVSHLFVRIDPGPDGGLGTQYYQFIFFRNGSQTFPYCAIFEPGTQCSDDNKTAAVCFDAGDTIAVAVFPGANLGTPAAVEVHWTAKFTPVIKCPEEG